MNFAHLTIAIGKKVAGQVLGVKAVTDAPVLVEKVLTRSYSELITTHDLRIVVSAGVIVGVVMIWQAGACYRRLKLGEGGVGKRVALNLILDMILFFGIVVGDLSLDAQLASLRAPRAVEYERISEGVARVKWETRDPSVGMVMWGESKNHLDDALLSQAGNEKTIEHEILLPVTMGKGVYFEILVGEDRYGNAEGEPFFIPAKPQYQLEEIPLMNNEQ